MCDSWAGVSALASKSLVVMTLLEMEIGQTLLPILTTTLWIIMVTARMWPGLSLERVISEFLPAVAPFLLALTISRFVGVAPDANLLSFKVFGTDGYSNEETVIEGFLKAFESGVSDGLPKPLCLLR